MGLLRRNRRHRSVEAPRRLRSGKRLAWRVVLALASLLIGLATVEIGFRAAHVTPWYERLVEEQTSEEWSYESVGGMRAVVRAPLQETPKGTDAYRVLFLGDSFTYGQGVTDVSKTFVSLVAQRLRAERPLARAKEYEVFNGGMPASVTGHWVMLFGEAADRFAPDLVVAVFFLRDGLVGVTSMGQIEKIREGMTRLAADSLLFRYSCAYRFLRVRRELTKLSRKYLGAMREGYLGRPDQTREWKSAQANLLRIRQRTLRRGGRFAMVIFPVLFELNEDYPLKEVCDELETFCHDHGIPVLSLLPTFMHRHGPSLWVSPFDQHPNELAHALAADAIYGFLEGLIRE